MGHFFVSVPCYLKFGVTAGLILMFTGCAAASAPSRKSYPCSFNPSSLRRADIKLLAKDLRSEVSLWHGTPHRLGGTSKRGIDCSAFVQQLYKKVFYQTIPRTTDQQLACGKQIGKKSLLPGDLIFFKISFSNRHVGIYLGRNEFAHASSSRGVIISKLNHPYWQKTYLTSRRYLNV